MQGGLYDWSAALPSERGEPFQPPPLLARATVTIAGVPVTLRREAWSVPTAVPFGEAELKPLRGGETLAWRLAD